MQDKKASRKDLVESVNSSRAVKFDNYFNVF